MEEDWRAVRRCPALTGYAVEGSLALMGLRVEICSDGIWFHLHCG